MNYWNWLQHWEYSLHLFMAVSLISGMVTARVFYIHQRDHKEKFETIPLVGISLLAILLGPLFLVVLLPFTVCITLIGFLWGSLLYGMTILEDKLNKNHPKQQRHVPKKEPKATDGALSVAEQGGELSLEER